MNDNKNNMIYVDEVIGQEYEDWFIGDIILIKAPTGRGKSHFILHTLLKHAIMRNCRILYMANRKILKEQLEAELKNDVELELYRLMGIDSNKLYHHIHIKTYQSIEISIKSDISSLHNYLTKFDYVIYDECHYFYSDSNYNTNTELSYDCLRREFDGKVQIFISATMDSMERFIMQRGKTYLSVNEETALVNTRRKNINTKTKYLYDIKRRYDYIKVFTFDDIQELACEIEESVDKWLIFIDSIENGEKFKEMLLSNKNNEKSITKEEIIFITANYENDEDVNSNVQELINQKRIGKRIVIATTVMDNGISFLDEELRNIVLMTDTEETFVQMLGRKRVDEENVNLYLCRRNIEHFVGRKYQVNKVIPIIREYLGCINNIYMYPGYANGICYNNIMLSPYARSLYINSIVNSQEVNQYKYNSFYRNDIHKQKDLLNKILNNSEIYKKACKVCYSLDGILAFNSFAVGRIYDLLVYYEDIINRLKVDSNAFLYEQLKWLGFSEEEFINVAISLNEKYKIPIIDIVEPLLGKKINTKENLEFKNDIKNELAYFYRKYEKFDKDDYRKVTRSDGTISDELFNLIMKEADLPYCMKKEGKSTFVITKLE